MDKIIDLRSDTVTVPTEKMRKAMYKAEVGDDVYRDDPTMLKLEALAAKTMGKEDALFVPSGTMGNQLSILTHTQRGDEIITEAQAHIFVYEVGALGFLAGVQAKQLKGHMGALDPAEVEEAIRVEDLHFPRTALICEENTHNKAGGTVIPLDTMEAIYKVAHKHNIPVHLDGARIFNAAVALGVQAKDIARWADSVMFCVSKGLCAPVGSLLTGSKAFIDKARKIRKMLGGGMRQAGILAAAAIVAITDMPQRLYEDHENARILAEGLAEIKGITVDLATVQTNMIYFDMTATGMNGYQLAEMLRSYGIKIAGSPDGKMRFVTHYYVTRDDVYRVLAVMKELIEGPVVTAGGLHA
jgi:Beta-eliminating lyase.